MTSETKFNWGYGQVEEPNISAVDDLPAAIQNEARHTELLEYLQSRLDSGQLKRPTRLQRYSTIDKMVSTWQQLTEEDTQRLIKQDATGVPQAIAMNLPLVTSYLDDMASFYANIYSPASGSFFQLPDTAESATPAKELTKKLNGDAEQTKMYKGLVKFLRTLLKYNIGGLENYWASTNDIELDSQVKGSNFTLPIDMYNFLWDPTIIDPAKISAEAEWAASITTVNRRWLVRRGKKGVFANMKRVTPSAENVSNGNRAKYYRFPPNEAGVTPDDAKSGSSGVNWADYSAALGSDEAPPIQGYEIVKMYCWLNPKQFDLKHGAEESEVTDDYQLWRFYIVDNKAIVYARPVEWVNPATNDDSEIEHEIPFYLGHMSQDEMGTQQRSSAELMGPFQNFASFLLNSHVAAARSAIYGLKVYDPTGVDMGQVSSGSTAATIPSKAPGRDVRSMLMKVDSDIDNGNTMQSLTSILAIMKEFFPSQALPSQIAGMDRAVTSQVSAVMQGVSRKMHMIVRTIDQDIMGPLTQAQYRNIVFNTEGNFTGLSDLDARRILGSGLQQLNVEQAEAGFRQLLFAVMQNQAAMQELDVMSMINYWSGLMNLNITADQFRKAAPAAPVTPQGPAPAPQGAPPVA